MTALSVSALFLFPVKSLRGFPIQQAELTPAGFRYDRQWMIVKPNGGFITQRQLPQMVLIHTRLSKHALILSKAGMSDIEIPLSLTEAETEMAKVWKDECHVVDIDKATSGIDVSGWLTEAIGTDAPLRLVTMAPKQQRPQSKPELLGGNTHTYFADAAPYLVTNQSSLDHLNQCLEAEQLPQVGIERFRPNILLEGLSAFDEHNLKGIRHADFQLKFCYPCQRCAIPTIDIDTAKRHPEQQPFKLLANINPMPGQSKVPAFGENAILEGIEHAKLSIGDSLEAIL